ncbi:YARHG domain-containing protein [Flexithrix dorotheae]|uniref:YARHG domain-containing protein n=1 Tax=Flexithrix dorotheae TaxID=70993 RepID=UPI00036A3319|nr:YARHG domain-containing protein [Flexithrix dorotheae]
MNSKSIFFIISFCFIFFSGFCQYYGDEKISSENLKQWVVGSTLEYSKTYHFGFSEGECDVRVIIDKDLVVVQIMESSFSSDGAQLINHYRTLTDTRIEGTKFFSKETDGEFMKYSNGDSFHAGLLLYKPWTEEFAEGGEFGSVYPDDEVYLNGKYPEASLRLLQDEDFKNLTKQQLKIMRNEIFARYGYIFRSGGSMEKYFNQQNWYKPQHADVNGFLTIIEKKNIQLIRKKEKGSE